MTSPAVLSISVTPKTEIDRERLTLGLQKLCAEDPTLQVRVEDVSAPVLIDAVGEMQIEIVVDRLHREFGVNASLGPPQVKYREALTRAASGEMKYARQVDGRGQYAHCKLHLFPGEPGSGYVFEIEVTAGAIPTEYIQSIKEGINASLTRGILSGYPIVDVRVELYDGSYHEVDSSEATFRIAGAMAFLDAAKRARPVLMEPVMRVEVSVPKEELIEIVDNLSDRGGKIQSQEERANIMSVIANVPISGMFGYGTDLRARTLGRGTYMIKFERYEKVDRSDENGASPVRVPLGPTAPLNPSSIALPEPRDS